jgi:hypothetical protein
MCFWSAWLADHISIRKAITASRGKCWMHLIEQQQALATEKMEFSEKKFSLDAYLMT